MAYVKTRLTAVGIRRRLDHEQGGDVRHGSGTGAGLPGARAAGGHLARLRPLPLLPLTDANFPLFMCI
ncbi:unnamed protein product [Pieris macdunnoughi]|uniref:Uncharacterized protein n=2 Tax=Pieris TaxID=7115 RepID=A0A9P0T709_PIEBR|nr:unnamed protein product [Pieris macdunnoughi]CAH4022926.1 unnamed protein product [Pieris brassicae]